MKYINRIFVVLLAVIGLASCEHDNIGALYTPTVQNVSFDVKSMSAKTSESSYTTNVRISRNMSVGNYTAQLALESANADAFTIENGGKVEFADGQTIAYTKVTASNMSKGQTYKATLKLSDADLEQADTIVNKTVTSCEVSVMCDYNWISAGKAVFDDVFWSEEQSEVNMLHAEGTNIYRIVSPYGNIDFTLASDGTIGGFSDGVIVSYSSKYQIYWYSKYPQYCHVENENGLITFSSTIFYNNDLWLASEFGMPDDRLFVLDWTKNYPLK